MVIAQLSRPLLPGLWRKADTPSPANADNARARRVHRNGKLSASAARCSADKILNWRFAVVRRISNPYTKYSNCGLAVAVTDFARLQQARIKTSAANRATLLLKARSGIRAIFSRAKVLSFRFYLAVENNCAATSNNTSIVHGCTL